MSSTSSIHKVCKVHFEKMDLGNGMGRVFSVTATDEHGHQHCFNMFITEDVNEITWGD
jgi:hypothetical protein